MKTYIYGKPDAQIVLIQPVDDHDLDGIENEVAYITQNCDTGFCLIAAKIDDWNVQLSPWEAPAVFGNEAFGSGAADTLKSILEICDDESKKYYLGGYSLAGLFALWAVCQTDVFCGAAAASPSVWFPDFTNYIKENDIKTDAVYLSLGDREEKTKNPIMATVGDRIRETYGLLQKKGVNCTLEWNSGNHFKEPDTRMAKAFSWLLKM